MATPSLFAVAAGATMDGESQRLLGKVIVSWRAFFTYTQRGLRGCSQVRQPVMALALSS